MTKKSCSNFCTHKHRKIVSNSVNFKSTFGLLNTIKITFQSKGFFPTVSCEETNKLKSLGALERENILTCHLTIKQQFNKTRTSEIYRTDIISVLIIHCNMYIYNSNLSSR